jgi:ATP-dependent Clp protease ATP-binding subunit ClpA
MIVFCQTKPSIYWMKLRLSSDLEMDSVPEELDEMNRRIMQLEIEREAIKRESDTSKLE